MPDCIQKTEFNMHLYSGIAALIPPRHCPYNNYRYPMQFNRGKDMDRVLLLQATTYTLDSCSLLVLCATYVLVINCLFLLQL